jgi:hypothetical protein
MGKSNQSAYFFSTDVLYQANDGIPKTWWVQWGDTDNYYGFSVRPWYANSAVTVQLMTAFTDRGGNQWTAMDVAVSGPGPKSGIRITAIRVPD